MILKKNLINFIQKNKTINFKIINNNSFNNKN